MDNHIAHNFDICYKYLKYLAIVGACSQNGATYARCWTPVTCLRCEQLDLDSVHFLTIRPMNLFWESSAPKFAKWVPYGPWNVSDLISDLMLWCCSDTLLVLLLLRNSADFCASLLFHLKLHQNISSVIFNWTSLKIWAFVVFYEAKRCSSYLLWPHWQCELLWFPLKQSAAAAALGAAAAGQAFLSWKGGSRQVSSKSPSLLQVINAASNRALHHNFESKCWLKNFFHTPESAIVNCQQVGTHPLQLTTQVFLAAVLTFFRIVSSLLQLRRINSTIEIWIMRCKYDLSTPFFQHKEDNVQTADTLIVESEDVQLSINSE